MKHLYESFDVTIAGAGPAGAILAYSLAKRGIKVLILEKSKLPRKKICAGGITVRACSLLPFDFAEVVENKIYGVRLSFHSVPKKVRIYNQPLAFMVSREKFDYFLAERAVEAGATLVDDVELQELEIKPGYVQVKTNSASFSTPILVGADGANSAVVRSLGLRSAFDYGVGLNQHIPVEDEIYAQWDGLMGLDYGIPGGYAWVFPKLGNLSVGAGGNFKVAKRLKSHTSALIQAYHIAKGNNDSLRGHLMPLKKASTSVVYHRVLLVGDAAGTIDPLTGEGIFYALKSTQLATEAIAGFLERKTADMSGYEQSFEREISPELRISRSIQRINTITPRFFFHFLENDDRFWNAFCRLLRGERTYQSLENRLNPFLKLAFNLF
jgi:geranylgeranyl reductase family protein